VRKLFSMQNHNYKIAIINPFRPDGLARTIFDGILAINHAGSNIDFKLSNKFDYNLPLDEHYLSRDLFISFAKTADLIFIIWGKDGTDIDLAEEINCWDKTIYIDGSEVGKNRRFDFSIQKEIIAGEYKDGGKIDREMLKKCRGYFRREKPYLEGIESLPFGIETQYIQNYEEGIKKDIDFVCIFGQDEYPIMRRYTRQLLERYCRENNFTCVTTKTKSSEEFYKLLARAKVGVSVGGGGFDTFRFWEILGNNCLLLTEKIDIFESDSLELDYRRIYQFNNLFDFQSQVEKLGRYLRTDYLGLDLKSEYESILIRHNSISRVNKIIEFAKSLRII